MDISRKILSDVVIYLKYAKYLPKEKRRETWEEIVDRNKKMHIKKFPKLKEEIEKIYKFVYDKKVLPSSRSNQYAGRAIEMTPNRMYNCCYTTIDHWWVFHEMMFLLLGGSGVGYSVQKHHVEKLPAINKPTKRIKRFLVSDSIEGWSGAIRVLFESYFFPGKATVQFDFSDIRPKGSLLKTSGGTAPGPQPLITTITQIKGVLDSNIGKKLRPIDAHDICCYLGDSIHLGGVRPSALISLFSMEDQDMLSAKVGHWWETNPQRARANNSVIIDRKEIKKQDFFKLWERIKLSGSGEPGVFFTNDRENMGTNPCAEISLNPDQFCNLTTLNGSSISSEEDFIDRVRAAAFLGTLQASYTDFHYLSERWKEQTEKESLLGVSITGLASNQTFKYSMSKMAKVAVEENKRVAALIGVNPAARVTCVKPEGTTSLVMGTSSGVHPWHSRYYIRRIGIKKHLNIYTYLMNTVPDLMEDDFLKPHLEAKLKVPIKAPSGAVFRSESPISLLERVKKLYNEWIKPGHNTGTDTHNVSATVSIRNNEWDEVGEWMWKNKNHYSGLSVLPYDGGTYVQAPFEECSKEDYEEMSKKVKDLDLKKVKEFQDDTEFTAEVACGGGSCEVK